MKLISKPPPLLSYYKLLDDCKEISLEINSLHLKLTSTYVPKLFTILLYIQMPTNRLKGRGAHGCVGGKPHRTYNT